MLLGMSPELIFLGRATVLNLFMDCSGPGAGLLVWLMILVKWEFVAELLISFLCGVAAFFLRGFLSGPVTGLLVGLMIFVKLVFLL